MRKGQVVPAELRARLSAALKGRSAVQNIGLVRSEGTREKIAAANRGKKASEETKAKMRASQQARRAASPVSEATKAKTSAALMGKPKTEAARTAMSVAKKGKPGNRQTEYQKLGASQRMLGTKWTEEVRQKLTGANSPHWGKEPRHKPRVEYRGAMMRSSWEVRFAQACDARNVDWVYEPVRFDLRECTYTPDFLLPETGAFWEVKGWLDFASQRKTSLFRELYPEVPLIVASGPVLQLFERGYTK